MFSMKVFITPQLAHQVVETLGGNCDLTKRFELVTESPINNESRCRKLQTNNDNPQWVQK